MAHTKNIYLPNLNGVRFVAAMLVFIAHTESVKNSVNLPNISHLPFFEAAGRLGVALFFVLSGMLITYLLLHEERLKGRIAVKKFYLRRVLRIWPLYFLVVGFALFAAPRLNFFALPNLSSVLSSQNLLPVALLFLFFLPNGVLAWYGLVPYAVQTWSIGAEEQFYLCWPLLLRRFKNRGLLFAAVFVLYNLVKLLLGSLQHRWPWLQPLAQFWYYFNIDCMAMGALAAYIVFYKKEKICWLIFHPAVQAAVIAALLILVGLGHQFAYFHFEIYSLLFAVLLANLAFNPHTLLRLEHPLLHYLGKISYGIYMYHIMALTITVKLLMQQGITGSFAIYSCGFAATVAVAALSYHGIEAWFLRLKDRQAFCAAAGTETASSSGKLQL